MNAFEGIHRLYGDGADRLAAAHVMVIGLGGVGSWTVEALARSGVGALTLVDGDDVCVTNINRQVLAAASTVGRPKAEAMAERVRAIHPDCRVTLERRFYVRTDAASFFPVPYTMVVDCVDGVTAKASIIGECHRRGIPVVTCGAAGGKVDPSQVQVADLSAVHHDRLMMFVRKLLRKHHGFPALGRKPFGVPCVFSPEPVRMPAGCDVAAVDEDAPDFGEAALNCEGRLGSAAFVTGAFGFHAAAVVANAIAAGSSKHWKFRGLET